MREHMGLYRGKRRDNGEWVQGWLVVNKAIIDPEEPEAIYCYILAYGKGESYVTWYPVDPDTVGECTGLTDKNGKLIFEGDVVEDASIGLLGDVVFSIVGVPSFGINDVHDGLQYHDGFWSDLEVIGNIHDNRLEDFDGG